EEAIERRRSAATLLAETLIDTAAYRQAIASDLEAVALDKALAAFNQTIRQREQACVDALLQLYRFGREDIDASQLPFSEGTWQDDLFAPETLKAFGLHLGSGA